MGGGVTLGWGFNMDSGTVVPVEKWTHVAITMDWTVKRASMYIDGKYSRREGEREGIIALLLFEYLNMHILNEFKVAL